ncbi:hypothetical protein M0804_009773 [Polistes exclamans]|nr:hypothetical protein M0804_009773 [Polistes exclamans]
MDEDTINVAIFFTLKYFNSDDLYNMGQVCSIPLDEITIWAATIDALSLCRFGINKHYCRMDSKYLFVFINNPDLNTYVGFLDENCNNADKIRKELKKFKSKTEFSSNSIALMHVSYARLKEFYALDISIFKDVFPNVCLFPFYGDRSFSTNGIIRCLCSIKPFSSFTINLKSNYNIIPADQTIPQLTLNFPTKSMSELMTYTFINESLADKYSIKKLCFNYDYEENELNIIVAEMKNSLRQFDPRTTVLIILSQSDYFVKFLDAFRDILKYWLLNYETKCPFNEILIWGAIVDRLSVCRFNLNKHHCRIDTELLLIFITNPSLKAYTVHLDVNCDSSEKIYSKLREFNSEINLSVHSIAFMHISYFRMRLFFGLDVHIFKEIFPNVYLFTFYGDASFNGSYLKGT